MTNSFTLDDHRSTNGAGAQCDHSGAISTDAGSIRCTGCQRQLIMVPLGDGEFRLEWVSSAHWALSRAA